VNQSQVHLKRLDIFLGVPDGTSFDVLIKHRDPEIINQKLSKWGIILDRYGMVPKDQRHKWKQLMQEAEISKRYWKDFDILIDDREIDELA